MIVGDDNMVGHWVCSRIGGEWVKDMGRGFGVMGDEDLIAGAVFGDWNGTSLRVHIAVERPQAMRELFRLIGKYCFEQLGAKMLILIAEKESVVRLHKRIGARLQTVIEGAGRDGSDMHISILTPDAWIWKELQ